MFKKIECYVAVCDVCGELVDAEVDAEFIPHYKTGTDALQAALDADSAIVEDRLCCALCWTWEV